MSQSILKNTISKFLLSVFNIFVPLLVNPYIHKLLNKEDFGVYNSATSIYAIFLVFASFGIYNYGVREISKVRDDKKALSSLFTNLFAFGIITNVVVSLVYAVYVIFRVESGMQAIYMTMIIQILANAFMVEWLNEAIENYGFITKKTMVVRIISTVLLFLVVTKPEHTLNYAILMSLTNVVNNLASFFYIKKFVKFDFSKFNFFKYLKPLSLLLVISNAGILYIAFDRVMITEFLGKTDISIISNYTIPSNLMNMLVIAMTSMITVSLPRLNYYANNGQTKDYLDLLDKSARGYLILLFPACMGLFCLGYEVMYLYGGGEKYIDSSVVLQLFALRFICISFYTIISNQIMYVYKKEKQIVWILLLGGILNVIMKFVLLFFNVLSPSTAVATMTIAEIVVLLIMNRYVRKDLKININLFSSRYLKYLYCSLPFIPIVYLIKRFDLGIILTCLISIPICVIVYFGVLFIVKDDTVLSITNKIKAKFIKTNH